MRGTFPLVALSAKHRRLHNLIHVSSWVPDRRLAVPQRGRQRARRPLSPLAGRSSDLIHIGDTVHPGIVSESYLRRPTGCRVGFRHDRARPIRTCTGCYPQDLQCHIAWYRHDIPPKCVNSGRKVAQNCVLIIMPDALWRVAAKKFGKRRLPSRLPFSVLAVRWRDCTPILEPETHHTSEERTQPCA